MVICQSWGSRFTYNKPFLLYKMQSVHLFNIYIILLILQLGQMVHSAQQSMLTNVKGDTFHQYNKSADFGAIETIQDKTAVIFVKSCSAERYLNHPFQTGCHQACLAHNRNNPNLQHKCNSIVHDKKERVCILGATPSGCLEISDIVPDEDGGKYYQKVWTK